MKEPDILSSSSPALPTFMVTQVVEELLRLLGDRASSDAKTDRERLRARLTVLGPGEVPEKAWPLLGALWAREALTRAITPAESLPRVSATGWGARLSLWRGDITTLGIDAIVNAANSGLTGCYRPLHSCVDNAIHTVAGPWLREECGRIMAGRGRPEPTGTATATAGYFLPARHVLHTVGPIVGREGPTLDDEDALRRCYDACLTLAAELGDVTSVAFCGISTGLFGYPTSEAAPLSLRTVRDFLLSEPRLKQVVLVAYTESDHVRYLDAIEEVLHE